MLQRHDLIIFKGAKYFENFEFVHFNDRFKNIDEEIPTVEKGVWNC